MSDTTKKAVLAVSFGTSHNDTREVTIDAVSYTHLGLMEAGYDVKMSEIHGMSQRGGSVSSQVRYGEKVMSPVIEKGKADIVVSFEKMEALRALDYLKEDGTLVVNNEEIPSMSVITGDEEYPEDVMEEIEKHVQAKVVNATGLARELGNEKAANIILLGTIIRSMGLEHIDWDERCV